ncbi:CHAD domain-containing protein [Stagnimonas aquatica]|uniref:CHAD domain-containing protein n=1 Tax=Stagnimonas aquatica TaxID=2689987 RepID=A0A3N0V7N9_9GAMM|nr:CHAD domain-containing protein [Stagnimonas aquatica]ROH88739.1 CHAD domain-containing protein [Stagnimonas aquatica]
MPRTPSLSTLAAAIAEELLTAMQATRASGADIDSLHRLRVAARRLRALLSLSCERLPETGWRPLHAALRALLRATGPTRDWQVLRTETLPALLPAVEAEAGVRSRLLDAAGRQESIARRRVGVALQGQPLLALLLALEGYLLACATLEADDEAFGQTATRVLERQHRRLRHRARHLQRDDPEALHQLRLRLKAQRYRVELLAPGYPGKAVRRYLARLKRLQDQLGQLQDLQVAQQHLRGLRLPNAPTRALRRQLCQRCAETAATRLANIKGLRLRDDGFRRFWD